MSTGIFERTISFWTSTKRSSRNRSETTVGQFLAEGEKHKGTITQLRKLYENATTFYRQDEGQSKRLFEEYKREKQQLLPLASISGNFAEGGRLENLIEPSNLACLDIDATKPHDAAEKRAKGERVPNEHVTDWEELKRQISRIPFVAYCALSVSGYGLYLIIPIKSAENYLEHWCALEYLFMKHYGLTIDPNTKDMSRARFVSYDPDPYVNPNARVFSAIVKEEKPDVTPLPTPKMTCNYSDKWSDFDKAAACVDEICKRGLNVSHEQDDWVRWGYALSEMGEAGRPLFHRISSLSSKYDHAVNDEKYDYLMRTRNGEIGLGAFFEYCKEHSISFADTIKRKCKQEAVNVTPNPQQRLETLRANYPSVSLLADKLKLEVGSDGDDTPTLADNPTLAKEWLNSSDPIQRMKATMFWSTYNAAMECVAKERD